MAKAAAAAQPDLARINEIAADLAREHAAHLVASLSQTRRDTIRRIIAQGLDKGLSDHVIRRRVKEVIGLDPRRAMSVQNFRDGMIRDGVPPGRAARQAKAYANRLMNQRVRTLADHELRNVLMAAQRVYWQEQQGVADLSVYAVRVTRVHKDERLCPVCKPQNGRRRSLWADIWEGPPFHPNCRCDEEIVDEGIMKGSVSA